MQRQYFRVIGVLCFIVSYFTVFSQMTLLGDVYIAPKNEMHLASGKLYFQSGKIITDRGNSSGTFSFSKRSNWESANHNNHVDGLIRFYDAEEFTFPVGHENVFQPIRISNFSGSDHFDLVYHHRAHEFIQSVDSIAGVSDTHFWGLRNPRGKGKVVLSWNVFTNIDILLGVAPFPEKAMDLITIGGFDGSQWIPIESELSSFFDKEGGVNSILEGYIQSKSRVDFSNFSAFTLMMRNIPSIDSKKISQAITPNGDGKNDTWIIERIEQYPNAKVFVYNRWGEVVFSASNGYNNDWAGNYKNDRDTLPTGPYLYVIDHDGNGKIDLKGWLYISD